MPWDRPHHPCADGCPAGMEWIPTEARAVVGTINGYCYTLGQFVLAAAAFGVPHWRWLQLVVSLPFFLFFLYSWYGEARPPAGHPPWLRGEKVDLWILGCLGSLGVMVGTPGSSMGGGVCRVGAGTPLGAWVPRNPSSPSPPRLFVESARWQVISGRPDLALKGLRKVARVNRRKEEGDKLSEEVMGGPRASRSPPPRSL